MVAALPECPVGYPEDRALLLVGFAGGFRRSELVSLNVGDLEFTEDGLVVRLRRSKTDQEPMGWEVAGGNPAGVDTQQRKLELKG